MAWSGRGQLEPVAHALGDLPAPTIPSGRLTPALRAQEKLGWRLGVGSGTFKLLTFSEAIDQAVRLGVVFVGGASWQKVSPALAKAFGPELTDEELKQARLKLDAAGVRLLTFEFPALPADEAERRKLFEFGRKMGIETFIAQPAPEALEALERLCEEYRIKLALYIGGGAFSRYDTLDDVSRAFAGRGPWIGICGEVNHLRNVNGDQALQKLKNRLMAVSLEAPQEDGPDTTAEAITGLRQLGLEPTLFELTAWERGPEAEPMLRHAIESINTLSLSLVK